MNPIGALLGCIVRAYQSSLVGNFQASHLGDLLRQTPQPEMCDLQNRPGLLEQVSIPFTLRMCLMWYTGQFCA